MLDLLTFQKVHQDLQIPLYNFAIRWVFDPGLAEDLVQEAFVKVWTNRKNVEVNSVKSLLFKMVQNQAINNYRKNKLRKILFEDLLKMQDPFEESRPPQGADCERLLFIKEELEKLPLKYRKILLLSFFGEFSYREISEIEGVSEGTVASRKNRGLNLLKSRMNGGLHAQ